MPVRASSPVHRNKRNTDNAPGSSKSLQKALRILLHLGENGPTLGVTELARALALNKATVFRLLRAMEKFGMIERSPEGDRYRLGLKLHELGTKAMESRSLRGEAQRFLLDMARRSQESVSLAVVGSGGVMCLERVDSAETIISVRTPVGALFPAHCTAAGKAVLAFLPEEEAEAILLRNGMPRMTPFTLTRMADVKADLRQTLQRGYALDQQELERGLSGVGAPILVGGRAIGAVGIAGPTLRFRGRELAEKVALARETATRIATSLGDRPVKKSAKPVRLDGRRTISLAGK